MQERIKTPEDQEFQYLVFDRPGNFEKLAGMCGVGVVFGIAEPFLKSLSQVDIANINKLLLEQKISFDAQFLHDQLTDYAYMVGVLPLVSAYSETILVDPMPDEGKWGIKKDHWRLGIRALSVGVLLGAGFIKESVDVLLTHNMNFAFRDIDPNDMRAYIAGLVAGALVIGISKFDRHKSVEIAE